MSKNFLRRYNNHTALLQQKCKLCIINLLKIKHISYFSYLIYQFSVKYQVIRFFIIDLTHLFFEHSSH